MRAIARTVKRGSQATTYDLSDLTYLRDASETFVATADVEFVVQGRRLPVHSQLLARSCEVWAALFESMTACGGSIPAAASVQGGDSALGDAGGGSPVHRSYGQVAAEAAAAAGMDEPLVFEQSFEGDSLAAVDNFLWCIYHPEGVSSRLDEGPHDLDDFSALLGLADRFNFGQLLRTIAADLEAATSELQPVGKDPALRLAIERDVYGWLHLALKHNLDDLKAHCLKMLMRQLASANSGPAELASDSWSQLPGSVREMLLEGVLSAAHRCQSKTCSVPSRVPRGRSHLATITGVPVLAGSLVEEELPSKERLLAWKGPGGFSAH